LVSRFPKIQEQPKNTQIDHARQLQHKYNQELQLQMKQDKERAQKERERDKQETLDQIQFELLKRDANQDHINQMKVKYQEQALNEWEANLKAKNLQKTLHSNVDRLQYEIIHGKFQSNQTKNQNSQLKLIDGE